MLIFIGSFEKATTVDPGWAARGFFSGRKTAVGKSKKPRRRRHEVGGNPIKNSDV
jgi:hypothetical protein